MERELLESQIIDYIDGKLVEAERTALERKLAADPEAYRLYEQFREVMAVMSKAAQYEPSSRLRMGFEAALAEELRKQPRGRQVMFFAPVVYRVAAGVALLAAGLFGGYWISNNQKQRDEIDRIATELEATKRDINALIQNQSSASQRLEGITVAFNMPTADSDIVLVLIRTMNEDPNSNVRLAAMEALGKFESEPVRKALVASLSTQKDPVVQIALIQLLVKLQEKRALKGLQNIVENEQNLKAVKDEAYKGIFRLS